MAPSSFDWTANYCPLTAHAHNHSHSNIIVDIHLPGRFLLQSRWCYTVYICTLNVCTSLFLFLTFVSCCFLLLLFIVISNCVLAATHTFQGLIKEFWFWFWFFNSLLLNPTLFTQSAVEQTSSSPRMSTQLKHPLAWMNTALMSMQSGKCSGPDGIFWKHLLINYFHCYYICSVNHYNLAFSPAHYDRPLFLL